MCYVYVLRSRKDETLYIGFTVDLKKRIEQHNLGESRYTKGHMPYELICYIAFKEKEKAVDFEKYLKSGSGKAFLNERLI